MQNLQMPWISFNKNFAPIEAPRGSNLMKDLLEQGVPVASSCGGEGVCAKCRVEVLKGRENLSAQNQTEKDLREIHQLAANERISCQALLEGDVHLDTGYW